MTLTRFDPDPDCRYAYGIVPFANALCVWVALQAKPVTIADAALSFNATQEMIRQAVAANDWMFVTKGDVIETDGE